MQQTNRQDAVLDNCVWRYRNDSQCIIPQEEGVARFQPLAPEAFDEALKETLLCFVLVNDSSAAHAFCSRYDFGPWPLLPGVERLPNEVHQVRITLGTSKQSACMLCCLAT